jgi:heparan-alpha-glucosaminide N-acetyltransferase
MNDASASPAPRLASLDAYRGFIMLLMASGGFGIPQVAKKLPDSAWSKVSPWFEHAAWTGGVLWDMIQPAFMFMVGVAAAFSVTKRLERGDSWGEVLRHAAVRAVVLVLLAVLLASNWNKQTVWLFTNVLGQIGLAYFFLVLMVKAGDRVRMGLFAGLLVGTWAAFALWPVGGPPAAADLKWMKESDVLTGFAAHWNPHTNIAAAFDRWFLNLFPRSEPYTVANGGYQTLNFVPSLATMLLGLMIGDRLRRSDDSKAKLRALLVWGVALLVLGLVLGQTACPIVKRIWTPSWALWSGGIVILMLAGFYAVMDIAGWKRWAFPLTVVGMNSIAIYLASQLSRPWIKETLAKHTAAPWTEGPLAPLVESCAVLLVLWLMCWWLWRQKAFLRI